MRADGVGARARRLQSFATRYVPSVIGTGLPTLTLSVAYTTAGFEACPRRFEAKELVCLVVHPPCGAHRLRSRRGSPGHDPPSSSGASDGRAACTAGPALAACRLAAPYEQVLSRSAPADRQVVVLPGPLGSGNVPADRHLREVHGLSVDRRHSRSHGWLPPVRRSPIDR